MNIVLGEQNVQDLRARYVVLELDTLLIEGQSVPVTAYCVLENLGLDDALEMQQYLDLHSNLIKNYRCRNWNYCKNAISYLRGRWKGQIDSFYDDLLERVVAQRLNEPAADWTGFVPKSAA